MKNLKNWFFGSGICAVAAIVLMLIQHTNFITSQFDDAPSALWLSGLIACGVAFFIGCGVNLWQKFRYGEAFNPADVFRTVGGSAVAWPVIALIGFGLYLYGAAVVLIGGAFYIHFKK